MTQTLIVNLERPIASAKFLDFLDDSVDAAGSKLSNGAQSDSLENTERVPAEDSGAKKNELSQACRAIHAVVAKLNQFYDKVFAEQKEEIAKLSVEIARKVLIQKVQDRDYKIESIVKEALNNAPTRQDIVVHLNPEDLEECQKALKEDPDGASTDVKFVSDSKIGRAECLLESPKGIVESLINEHLERIGKALKKTE
jgi:flagellar biosynthesis/type III secretory pathway protein FliH